MPDHHEQRERERKRAAANCQKFDYFFLPLAKQQTSQFVEMQTTSSASVAVDSVALACNSPFLLVS